MALTKRLYVDRDVDIPITAANLNDIQDEIIGNTSYAVCSTAAGTATKTATIEGFILTVGRTVKIKFANTNTASTPTLNVSGTGAKAIMMYGDTPAGNNPSKSWVAGEVVQFVYDGTNWIMQKNFAITYEVVSTW